MIRKWILPALCAVVAIGSSPAQEGGLLGPFDDESAFFEVLQLSLGTEDFEGFDVETCLDSSFGCEVDLSGFELSSPYADGAAITAAGPLYGGFGGKDAIGHLNLNEPFAPSTTGGFSYFPIEVRTSNSPASGSLVAAGGETFVFPQRIDIEPTPFSNAVGFFLTDLDRFGECSNVVTGSVTIRLQFDSPVLNGETVYTVTGDGDIATPEFFGIVAEAPIFRVIIEAGEVCDCEEKGGGCSDGSFGLDDITVGSVVADLGPPSCERLFSLGGPTDSLEGRAEAPGFATTLQSIEPVGAVNAILDTQDFEPGDSIADFTVSLEDPSQPGGMVVVATDSDQRSCFLRADFQALEPGPLEQRRLCFGDGILLEVSNAGNTAAGISACSSTPFTPGEPLLPPGYLPSPPEDPFPCRVLTIDGPVEDETEMIYKKDGVFIPQLRLLFSEFDEANGVFPDFIDITDSVDQIINIVPDPTRLRGVQKWTPVKIACAELTPDCNAADQQPDLDGDGLELCDDEGNIIDCEPQNPAIPGPIEFCNGLDDNCDGTVDEGFFTGDNDNFADCFDNCPFDDNPLQEDSDGDGIGDACDFGEQLCGSLAFKPGFDFDLYTFQGIEGQDVSLLLDRDGDGNAGNNAILTLFSIDRLPFFGAFVSGPVPLSIERTLPFDGTYFVTVARRPGNRPNVFRGDYCVNLDGEGFVPGSFEELSILDDKPKDDGDGMNVGPSN